MPQNGEAARRHLDERFKKIGPPVLFTPPMKGWIRAIRDALGMSTTQLAKKLGVPQSRVVAIEKGECAESLSINTLKRVADALDCELVYALVPRNDMSLKKMVEHRAYEKAKALMELTSHTMSLEDQKVSDQESTAQVNKLADKLLQGSPRKLWEEP